MKFNVTEIEFDLNDSLSEEYQLTFDDEIALRDDALGVWEADDEEVHQVWEIVGNALDRNGFVDADGELSIRVYDETLKKNVKVLDKSLL